MFYGSISAQVKAISPRVAERKIKNGFTILDVRTAKEFDAGKIEYAENMDIKDSAAFMQQISTLDKNKSYLVYCRSGKRSSDAADLMQQQGFTRIYNMKGGILAWDRFLRKKKQINQGLQ
ncbi:MAG: rhodanese-like domain-containing protein [Chitinophagaceae bacterium]|nr:rhodanese-like domain-containing protein [Chitinophagaceae bacterium]